MPFPVLWLHCASFRARGARDGDNPRREALKCARFHDLISMPPPGALRCYDHGSSDQLAGSIAISLLLVTGGAGFVGSHLAEALLRGGAEVAVTDDLSTGSIDNIEHLKGLKNFSYTIDTLLNRPHLAELVDRADVIFHLAAAVGVRLIVESPVRTIETNVKGTELVLELAAKKAKKVVLTSTSEVYGKANKIPFGEDDDLVLGPTVKGRWSYACSKALTERRPHHRVRRW